MAEEKKERLSRQEKKEQQLEAIRKLIEEKGGVAKTSELYTLGSGLPGTPEICRGRNVRKDQERVLFLRLS